MWRILATARRNLGNRKKRSRRVADENIFHNLDNLPHVDIERRRSGGGWRSNGLAAVLYCIIRAPFSMISCLSDPRMNGADDMWMSAELPQIAEVNHLNVRDSMRYAILM
ncbi:unnamed protein product [Fraxinus pennsylvanica]|uniref:Uncharacterized protein n=1 Tax=Fraxinus pennsylvanica TaxID=56036 RepID=A0AAD2DJL0_9LAMI|nr:unnamed protein product [Fraxinus pennsylvanica]